MLREAILPNLSDEWPRNCAAIAGALDYAIGLLKEDRAQYRLPSWRTRCRAFRSRCRVRGQPSSGRRPRALVWSCEDHGPEADVVRAVLHPVLVAQMDREAAASEPLLTALHVAMRGTDNK